MQGEFVLRSVTALPPALGPQLRAEPRAGLWVQPGTGTDSTPAAPSAGCSGPSASLVFGHSSGRSSWTSLPSALATQQLQLCVLTLNPLSGLMYARQCVWFPPSRLQF